MTERRCGDRTLSAKLNRYLARAVFAVIVGIMAAFFVLIMLITLPIYWLGHELLRDEDG